MAQAPVVVILLLSLTVAYLFGSLQGQKQYSPLTKDSKTQKIQPASSPTPTLTPSPYPTIKIVPTAMPTQEPKKCQFSKETLTAYFKATGVTDEVIGQFFTIKPGDCFNFNTDYKPEPINNNFQQQQNSYCQQQMSNYQDCVNENSKRYQDYVDCLSNPFGIVNNICNKPYSAYCSKPSCN